MIELYINGQLMDIDQGEVIACTYQRNDLGELKDRQADYTNEFKLPLTARNKIALGNPDLVQTYSSKPYMNNTARLLQNGVEIIASGVAEIKSSNVNNYVNVTIYSGIFDLFARLGDKTLKDLDLEDLSHIWNNVTAFNYRANSEGVIYPLIKTETSDISDYIWTVANQAPSVYIKTLIDKIIKQAGYNYTGDLIAESRYQNMILPCTDTFERGEQWVKDRSCFVGLQRNGDGLLPSIVNVGQSNSGEDGGQGGTAIGHSASYGEKQFPFSLDFVVNTHGDLSKKFTDGSKDNFKSSNFAYVADIAMTVRVEIKLVMQVITPVAGDCDFKFLIKKNGVTVNPPFLRNFQQDGEKVVNIDQSITLNQDDYITFHHELSKDGGIGQPELYYYYSRTYLQITPSKVIPINSFLDISSVIPDIKQKDFLKSILQIFGVTVQNDNYSQVLNLSCFKNIASRTSLDWSNKLDIGKEIEVSYRLGNYAQDNIMKWSKNAKNSTFGNGSFKVNDETLEENTTVIELPYASSIEGKLFPTLERVADIPLVNGSYQRQNVEPRLLMVNRNKVFSFTLADGINSNITISNSSYPFAYFSQAGLEGLDFEDDIIPEYYSDLAMVLDKCKVVICYLDIKESDIQSLDFSTPVYIEYFNSRFYINKIEDYTGIGSTKCELIRL